MFSSIATDQAHEHNNACIKGDGGAVGLTDNPSVLRRLMVAGPEVATVIEEYQDANQYCRRQTADTHHHDQTPSVQASFVRDLCFLIGVIEEIGNSFEEESQDLAMLDSKDIASTAAVETVTIGQEQFEAFTRECLWDKRQWTTPYLVTSKGQQQVTSAKDDSELFARLPVHWLPDEGWKT